MELLYLVEDLGEKTRQFTLLMQPVKVLLLWMNLHPRHNSLFLAIHPFSSPVVIYFNFIRTQLTTSVDVHIGSSCSWKINFKGSIHLQGSLFVCEEKTKTDCLSHCVTSKCPTTACRPWNEFLSVAAQSGLYAAPTLCLDERCVLMRAVWEFNEARWEWAWSYGRLLMWDVLRGFLFLCFYELDTFYGIQLSPSTGIANGIFHDLFFKELHSGGDVRDPDLNCFIAIIWPKRPGHI